MTAQKIPNILACDAGNTTIHFAHVRGDDIRGAQAVRIGALGELGRKLADLWREMDQPKKIVACSVNPSALKALEAAADEETGQDVIVIGRDVPLPMETELPDPQSVGTDRLCCAVAAYDRIGQACVVADFGTAITIDCVNDDGVFLGGTIMPGLAMSAEALHNGTAQLPRVEPTEPPGVIGKDTNQAMVGGIIFGARGALRERIEAYATLLGHWPLVILTGGDARLICPDPNTSELVQAVVPDLVLRGVAMAYYRTLLK